MANNMLTTKELTLLSDLLIYEQSACKKARLYSRTLTDQTLAEQCSKLADNHQSRYQRLLELL